MSWCSFHNPFFSATFSSNNSSSFGSGCDDGFLVGRERVNSSALNADVPVFDPQAIEEDDITEDDMAPQSSHGDEDETLRTTTQLRQFAH